MLHYADFIGYSLVAWVRADEHLIVVLHQIDWPKTSKVCNTSRMT